MLIGFTIFITIVSLITLSIIYAIVRLTNKDQNSVLNFKEFSVESGIFLSMIVSVTSLISIVFTAIDKQFPDVLSSNYYSTAFNSDLRSALALLIVFFPICIYLAYMRSAYYISNPSRASLPSTKMPHYVTLYVSLIALLISLATAIYYYLGGELVQRFGFKILAVFVVLSLIGAYHYVLIKRDWSKTNKYSLAFAILSTILVVGSIIYSINVLGTPSEIRNQRFDEKRLEDLSSIQSNILGMWQRNKKLPENLAAVYSDTLNTYQVMPRDPKTKESYTYSVIENSKMIRGSGQECVNFYPSKFNNYNQNGNFDINKITCDLPTKATFKICATFETVRMYDENGIDQSMNAGFDYRSPKYAMYNMDVSSFYYPGSVEKNPNWNHEKGNHCFERVVDPSRYPSY